jgi:hypothetical protein
MATMKTFIVLLESTLFTSWKTCLSRKKGHVFNIFNFSVSNMRLKIIIFLSPENNFRVLRNLS